MSAATSPSHLSSPPESSLSWPLILQPRKGPSGEVADRRLSPLWSHLPRSSCRQKVAFLTAQRAVSLVNRRGSGEDGSPKQKDRSKRFPSSSSAPEVRQDGFGSWWGWSIIRSPCSLCRLPAGRPTRSTRLVGLHGSAFRWEASQGHLGYHLLRAQRAPRAQRATLGAGDAQALRPPLLLLPPRAGCGQDRRRGPATHGPSHAAILTRAASPPSPVRDFRNQNAISLSPGKGTMLRRGREP